LTIKKVDYHNPPPRVVKGATSKEMVETRSSGNKLFYGQIPRIFG
jgi:hypothetical protein